MPAAPLPERIARDFLAVYQTAELDLLTTLARAVVRGLSAGSIVDEAVEAIRLRRETQRIVAQLTEQVAHAGRAAIAEAATIGGRQAIADLNRLVERGHSYDQPINSGALNRLARSLSNTLDPVHLAVTRVVDDAYKRISGRAATGVLTGQITRRQAAQRALDGYARQGIRGFRDRAGRRWELASYAEMSLRSATGRAAVDAHTDRLVANGIDLVVVSDSPQECRLCRPWEGKILAVRGSAGLSQREHATEDGVFVDVDIAGTVDRARSAGLLHPNCTHSLSAYLPGVTRPATATANPQGDEDRQRLRYLERQVRAAKRVEAVATDPASARAARADVRLAQARIREHVAATGLIRQSPREQIGQAR